MEGNSDQSQKKLGKLQKLYTQEKQYRGKLIGTIYSLQDQLEEYKEQSNQRHDELNREYQRQIQLAKSAEAQSQSLKLEVTALRQDRDVKSKLIEKLMQHLRVSNLAQKADSESNRSDKSRTGPSLRHQNLPALALNLETAVNSSCHSHAQADELHNNNRPFQCSQCHSSFTLKGNLKRHIQSVHTGQRSFQCMQCDASFKLKNHLTRHLTIHLDKYDCDFCEKRFKTEMKRRVHVDKFHSDDRPFQCTQCDSTFKRKRNLNKHIQMTQGKVEN